ncbi:abortive infection family protein [Alloalcanivorax gelatiniphagus]|uniref:Abortive infection protein-like C-terminal domain-containing protein n=1 Tax=Alloalcanivorax gelatiniphagus TaxID=1194167 RepID=A0ABY2XQN0_9GAMM|nr:abortive infection family protein [Alloalcanivorax gelatiniphagus]TMW15211.1 hypothetical protein FGS76_00115 [Alloalcanivorax gelatiniphagus]
MKVEVSYCLVKAEANGDKYKIKKTIAAINSSLLEGESGLVVGQCKALIERLCKSVLKESGEDVESSISMGRLAKKAITALGVERTGNENQKTREAFIKLVNSFSSQLENAAGAIGTLRNEYCPVAHGRGYDEPQLHMLYAHLVASQTDSLATFILELVEHKMNFVPQIRFSDNEDYNEHLYEQFGEIEVYGDLYQAPDILFKMNPSVYRRGLEEYREGGVDDQ